MSGVEIASDLASAAAIIGIIVTLTYKMKRVLMSWSSGRNG